jgi:hypothetical protein
LPSTLRKAAIVAKSSPSEQLLWMGTPYAWQPVPSAI